MRVGVGVFIQGAGAHTLTHACNRLTKFCAAPRLPHCQAGNKSYVGALAYAPPGFLPELENGAVVSGEVWGVL